MTDYTNLKRLAEAMSLKVWEVAHPNAGARGWEVKHGIEQIADALTESRARYIAAANPAAVLGLLAEVEWLKRFEADCKEWHEKTEWVKKSAQVGELGMHRADVLKGRIDRLKAENEALRKDAERYRWLREQEAERGLAVLDVGRWEKPATCIALAFPSAEELDAAIDHAMSKESAHV